MTIYPVTDMGQGLHYALWNTAENKKEKDLSLMELPSQWGREKEKQKYQLVTTVMEKTNRALEHSAQGIEWVMF